MATWYEHDGNEYDVEVLTPSKACVRTASYIGADGVEPIVLLELTGALDGRPYKLAIEMTARSAVTVGASLMATDPQHVDDLATVIMAAVAFNGGMAPKADRLPEHVEQMRAACLRVRDAAGISFES